MRLTHSLGTVVRRLSAAAQSQKHAYGCDCCAAVKPRKVHPVLGTSGRPGMEVASVRTQSH